MAPLTDAMKHLVRAQRLGYVASVTEDGAPMVSPKGSLTVWDDTHLVFADIDSPHTVKNLTKNPRTEVNVVDPFLRKGFRFTGMASVLHTGAVYWKVLEHYKSEGADIRRIRAVVLIEVTQASPLVSPVYAAGFTEDEVGSLWQEFHTRKSQKTVLDLTPPSDF